MKKHNLTPFSQEEKNITYEINSFSEMDKSFAVLVHKDLYEMPMANNYRFGVLTDDGYFWFFDGKATTSDRIIAIDVYVQLLDYCIITNLGKPFAYKEFQKREQN